MYSTIASGNHEDQPEERRQPAAPLDVVGFEADWIGHSCSPFARVLGPLRLLARE